MAAFAALLAGCGGGGAAVSQSEPSDIVSSGEEQSQKTFRPSAASLPAAAGESQPLAPNIYVAMANLPNNKNLAALAIWQGQFLVDNGCFIFRSYSTDYLPVFSTRTAVAVGRDSFNVAGLTRKLGETVSMGGGEVSGLDRYLIKPVPASCTKKFIRF